MSAALLKLIWLQPLLARKNLYPTKWLTFGMMAVVFGPALLSLVFTRPGDWLTPTIVVLVSAAICIAVFILFWFISFLPYCVAQYTPANAAMLANLRLNLRLSLLLPIVGLSALISLAFLREGWSYMALVYILGLLSACLYGAGLRDKRYFYLLSLVFVLPLVPASLVEKAELFGAFSWFSVILLSLPLVWRFSAWLLPEPGDKVFDIRSNFQGYKRALEGGTGTNQINLQRDFDPYYRRLAGLLAQGQAANKLTLSGMIFGNEAYALTMIVNTFVFGLPLLLILCLLNAGKTQGQSDFPPGLALLIFTLVMQQTFYFMQIKMICARRYEQAFLMLAPRFDNTQTQRMWAGYLLSQYLQLWITCVLVWWLMKSLTQIDKQFAEWCFLVLIAGLAFVPGLFSDFRKLSTLKMSVSLVYTLQLMSISLALCVLRYFWASPPFYLFVITCTLPLLAYTYWKWRHFLKSAAFPAGYI